MIHSMTGFGDAQLEIDGHVYHVEIRSVNNRYLKADVHFPDNLAFLEPEAERVIREHVSRGSVTVRVFTRDLTPAAAGEINVAAVQHYVRQLRTAAGSATDVTIDLATLAAMPGVCQPRELTPAEREGSWEIIQTLLDAALERMIAMRRTEGEAVAEDLRAHTHKIRTELETVRLLGPRVVAEYQERLLARVQQLLAASNVDLARDEIRKEVAIYADRSDISEEISRLNGHLDQFEKLIVAAEPAGRKLEFISQEMLREANTMGSKTGDPELSRAIIEIKSCVDRLKEQVQNVE